MTVVQFSEIASRHVEETVIWLRGAGGIGDRFLAELERMTTLLASSPEMGLRFGRRRRSKVRRVLLRQSERHVYYVYRAEPESGAASGANVGAP